MSWFPALDLAAQYWQGQRSLPPDCDVLDRLRRAISELTPEEMEVDDVATETAPDEDMEEQEEAQEKRVWNVEEDRLLKKLVKAYYSDWETVAARLPGRTPFTCRKRWEKRLKRKANTQHWSTEEDDIILALHKKLGDGKWREIAEYMSNRSAESIQNRFHVLQKPPVPIVPNGNIIHLDESFRKEEQIEQLRQNAQLLEARIQLYKKELGKLENELSFNQS